jgi:hypothetical protein
VDSTKSKKLVNLTQLLVFIFRMLPFGGEIIPLGQGVHRVSGEYDVHLSHKGYFLENKYPIAGRYHLLGQAAYLSTAIS